MFVGERGSDTGGLTREFFRLIQYSIKSKYMEDTGCFRHNAVAYQVYIIIISPKFVRIYMTDVFSRTKFF